MLMTNDTLDEENHKNSFFGIKSIRRKHSNPDYSEIKQHLALSKKNNIKIFN